MTHDSFKNNNNPTIAVLLNTLLEAYDYQFWKNLIDTSKKFNFNILTFSGGAIDSPYYYHASVKYINI